MKFILALLLLATSILAKSQQATDYSAVDNVMSQIPEASIHSTEDIAQYINKHFKSETDKVRAAFIWVAKNIRYDVANMYSTRVYKDHNEIVIEVLKKRKGICTHFAELFHAINQKTGIKSYVIGGYTKQNGAVDNLPHSWCAAFIDSKWYLFDPTWGSGSLQNNKYVRQINNYFFKTQPGQLISSHMPFDPLWQFQNYPLTNQEFYDGKVSVKTKKPFFNYQDTLTDYENKTELDQLLSSSRRIEQNGIKNSLISTQLKYNKQEIDVIRANSAIEQINEVVVLYNKGTERLNQFINYRNNAFRPQKPDDEINQMLYLADDYLTQAQNKLANIKSPDSNTTKSINQFKRSITNAQTGLKEQKAFLEKYLRTEKKNRKSLFNR